MALAKIAGFFTLLMALGLCILLLHKSSAASYASEQNPAKVERLDPAASDIIPDGAVLLKLSTGYTWTEGPIWTRDGYLLFADIPSNTIRKLPAEGEASIFLQPSGYLGPAPFGGREPGSNGMTLDAHGRLTVAGHGQRDVYRIESLSNPGQTTILADTFEGKRLNSPNDLVYKSDGSLYFTDPPYGLPTQKDTDPKKELKVNGVYRLAGAAEQKPGAESRRDKLQLLIKDLPRPNGIAFSPDEKYLYVTAGFGKTLRWEVQPDGSIANAKMFIPAGNDGMKVDSKGNLYAVNAVGPGEVWITSQEGKHLGTLQLPQIQGV